MKNIKDFTISIFAIIGFVAIITAFTNQHNNSNITTNEPNNIWEVICSEAQDNKTPAVMNTFYTNGKRKDQSVIQGYEGDKSICYMFNKATGKIRMLSKSWDRATYSIMQEK